MSTSTHSLNSLWKTLSSITFGTVQFLTRLPRWVLNMRSVQIAYKFTFLLLFTVGNIPVLSFFKGIYQFWVFLRNPWQFLWKLKKQRVYHLSHHSLWLPFSLLLLLKGLCNYIPQCRAQMYYLFRLYLLFIFQTVLMVIVIKFVGNPRKTLWLFQ